jgi:hypothetical protein
MIEGLKIDVPSAELVEHLETRVRHHRERRTFYETQAASFLEGAEQFAVANVTNDPVHGLESSAKSHSQREAFFRFLAEHVVEGETYRLDERDLERLEMGRYL